MIVKKPDFPIVLSVALVFSFENIHRKTLLYNTDTNTHQNRGSGSPVFTSSSSDFHDYQHLAPLGPCLSLILDLPTPVSDGDKLNLAMPALPLENLHHRLTFRCR